MLDRYIIIKSHEDLTQIYLFAKRYINDKFQIDNMRYENTDGYKIYVEKSCFNKASEAFAEYLIRNYVFFFVQEFIDSINYEISFEDEIDLTESLSLAAINCKNPNILDVIKKDLEEFAKIYSEINLDGFVIFSFRKYEQTICDCISEELIAIKAEEEYEKILCMVSEYINDCNNNLNMLNIVLLSDNEFICYDELHIDVTGECNRIVENEFGNSDYSFEDKILSILLTQNPAICTIHLKGYTLNENLLYTLKRVFGKKIRICKENCEFCKS